jgi:competence protein ComEC
VFIDVGQGDSTLIQSPSGATVLVDGGVDERVLEADLRGRGLRYIDAVVVSHPDADHIGGLKGAFDTCDIGVMVSPATDGGGLYADLLGRAEDAGTPVRVMRQGDRLCLGGLELHALSPPRELPEGLSVNEASLVLRALAPGLSLLLTGDVEEEGEAMLMEGGESLRCDLLKVPHHGGYTEGDDRFFSHIKPKIAVISVGEGNRFGHPSMATVDSLRRAGAAVYRTDLCGDIVIDVIDGGYRVKCQK